MTAGRPYVVGERGPELFLSDVSGMIVPQSGPGRAADGGSILPLDQLHRIANRLAPLPSILADLRQVLVDLSSRLAGPIMSAAGGAIGGAPAGLDAIRDNIAKSPIKVLFTGERYRLAQSTRRTRRTRLQSLRTQAHRNKAPK